ncbi:Predicted membrane protein [Spirosomataceae bacterium TFI 002]|nr:Predicted membrane protein [Spirosomataceae bacterium TFI 002]
MDFLVGDTYGLIHLISSIIALIAGILVLILRKGTKSHMQIGYVYVMSMFLMIITAFMIYRLFGGWGIFHYSTVAILVTILLGMIPVWTKKPANKWKFQHFSFMYWSVVGLYAAFAAELLTRIPESPFFGMVGIASGLVMIIGVIFFRKNKAKWVEIFGIEK